VPASVPFLEHPESESGAVSKRGRSAMGDSVTELTGPAPGTYAALLQSEVHPLHGSVRPYPPGTVVDSTIVREARLYGLLDRATPSYASTLGALPAGQSTCTYDTEQSTRGSRASALAGTRFDIEFYSRFGHPCSPGIDNSSPRESVPVAEGRRVRYPLSSTRSHGRRRELAVPLIGKGT